MSDELDRADLDAWDVDPLPPEFEDRVLAAWEEPAERRRVWPVVLAVVAAVLLAVVLWPRAASMNPVAVRPEPAAQVDYVPGSGLATQTAGTVTYEVQPGTPFEVHTPAADIAVHGTAFTVEMMTMNDERRRKFLGATALAMGGAAVAVYVASGEVEVRNEHGTARVTSGETAIASRHAAPRRGGEPSAVMADAAQPGSPARRGTKTLSPQERADVQRRLAQALSAPSAAERPDDAPEQPSDEPEQVAQYELPALDRDYIQSVVTEDLVPIAKECYESALADDPELGGKMVVRFSIVGDPSVGGIVEDAVLDESSTLRHPALSECMTESTASLLFDPPEDGGSITVSYPFVFSNDPGEP